MRDLFARSFSYENRAADAIQEAKKRWANVEEVVNAIEWGLAHDLELGARVTERGIRGFTYPGARSLNEPDVDVLYEDCEPVIVIHDLTFRDAKASYAGNA